MFKKILEFFLEKKKMAFLYCIQMGFFEQDGKSSIDREVVLLILYIYI